MDYGIWGLQVLLTLSFGSTWSRLLAGRRTITTEGDPKFNATDGSLRCNGIIFILPVCLEFWIHIDFTA